MTRYTFKGVAYAVKTLHPAYFALVMATGIVALSAFFAGLNTIAIALSWFNTGAFAVLWIMYLARLVFYPGCFFGDIADFERGPGYFTLVAGTSIFGAQALIVFNNSSVAVAMWASSVPLWACLTYAIFAAFTVKECKPSLGAGINGGWLIAVVATQAVSNLGTLLSARFPAREQEVLFFSFSLWLCGGMIYIWLIALIFYRYMFFHLAAADLAPSYWINMGAMAVSTLAGTTLIEDSPRVHFLSEVLPFLKGFTVFYWATATWWIPMLLILECWRHAYKRYKLAYHTLYWGAVFPLGMYAASTNRLSHVLNIPFLLSIQRIFVYLGLAAWLVTFLGFLGALRNPGRPETPH